MWRDASKPAAAYPLTFDLDAFPDMPLGRGILVSYACWTTTKLCLCPTRESLDFLVKLRKTYVNYAATQGSVRLLKWTRENNLAVECVHVPSRSRSWAPARSQVLARERVPLGLHTCYCAASYKRWDCLQYAVDNKCPEWEYTPRSTRSTSDEIR